MEIDKETIDVLGSKTRIEIMKSLSERRKTITELSKELKLAKSTVSEHVVKLENTNLIIKKDSVRKWKYYELTSKGNTIIKPKPTLPFAFVLTLGIILIISSGMMMNYGFLEVQGFAATESKAISADETMIAGGTEHETNNIEETISIQNILLLIGIILTIIGSYKLYKIKTYKY